MEACDNCRRLTAQVAALRATLEGYADPESLEERQRASYIMPAMRALAAGDDEALCVIRGLMDCLRRGLDAAPTRLDQIPAESRTYIERGQALLADAERLFGGRGEG